jgi:hypothetical protein
MSLDSIVGDYAEKIVKSLKRLYIDSYAAGAKEVNPIPMIQKTIYSDAVDYFHEQSDWIIDHFHDFDASVLHGKLSSALAQGSSFGEFWKTVKDSGLFSHDRARKIFRTESARAYSEGTVRQYQKEGVKKINTLLGPNPCPICVDINQSGPYNTKDVHGMLPIHPNCSCVFVDAKYAPKPKLGRVGDKDYKWSIDDKEYDRLSKIADDVLKGFDKNLVLHDESRWRRASYAGKFFDSYILKAVPQNVFEAQHFMWGAWNRSCSTGPTVAVLKGMTMQKMPGSKVLFHAGYINRNAKAMNKFREEYSYGLKYLKDNYRGVAEADIAHYFDALYLYNSKMMQHVYGKKVKLYRGLSFSEWKQNGSPLKKGKYKTQSNSITSWSDNRDIADNFNHDIQFLYDAHPGDVLTSYLNGHFTSYAIEAEYVMIGGERTYDLFLSDKWLAQF